MPPSRNSRNILNAINKYPPSASEAQSLIEVLEPLIERKYIIPSYSVTVNYNQTVEQLIKAGEYYWFSDKIISENFPSIEKGVAEILVYLVNFNFESSSEEIIKRMNRNGLRPATLKELLALGAAQPGLQRTNRIVSLGTTWRDSDGYVLVPYLCCIEYRELLLTWRGAVYSSSWCFAAVAKSDELTKK